MRPKTEDEACGVSPAKRLALEDGEEFPKSGRPKNGF
jgi:hypothetical protein